MEAHKNSNFSRKNPTEINDFGGILVRVVRLERTVSWSQTRRDTNFAIPGYLLFRFSEILLSVVKAVVRCNFEVLSKQGLNPATDRVPTAPVASPSLAPDSGTLLPKRARYQLRYTPILLHFFPYGSGMGQWGLTHTVTHIILR